LTHAGGCRLVGGPAAVSVRRWIGPQLHRLQHPEGVSLGVLEIRVQADAGDLLAVADSPAAGSEHPTLGRSDVLDGDRADVTADAPVGGGRARGPPAPPRRGGVPVPRRGIGPGEPPPPSSAGGSPGAMIAPSIPGAPSPVRTSR